MKQLFILSVFTVFIVGQSSAKIWRINNMPAVVADFTTPQLANDNPLVQPGDTLHIEPSNSNYGNLTMTKRLTVISIGDFFTANPNLQYTPYTGILNAIIINNINANGSVLQCNLNSVCNLTGVSNIRVERCHIGDNLNLNGTVNISVVNSVLRLISVTNSTSIVVSNNIILYYVDMNASSTAVISNNVLKSGGTGNQTSDIFNSTFQNNIINVAGLTLNFTSSTVQNNLTSNAALPAGNGNVNNVNMATVFVDPTGAKNDISYQLQTAVANPAAGAAGTADDLGAFGGTAPYKPGLQPAIPAIYKITAPVAPTGNTMNVTFSTRSNN